MDREIFSCLPAFERQNIADRWHDTYISQYVTFSMNELDIFVNPPIQSYLARCIYFYYFHNVIQILVCKSLQKNKKVMICKKIYFRNTLSCYFFNTQGHSAQTLHISLWHPYIFPSLSAHNRPLICCSLFST
jgi:hypothetical protein